MRFVKIEIYLPSELSGSERSLNEGTFWMESAAKVGSSSTSSFITEFIGYKGYFSMRPNVCKREQIHYIGSKAKANVSIKEKETAL